MIVYGRFRRGQLSPAFSVFELAFSGAAAATEEEEEEEAVVVRGKYAAEHAQALAMVRRAGG